MSGYLRIGGALFMGVIIILAAFTMARNSSNATAQTAASLEVAQGRGYIEPTDSDGDGTPDWEENITDRIFDSIDTPTSTDPETEEYTPPTTFTGKFSEAFFEDYMKARASGDEEVADPTTLINNAVAAIEANTQSKTYAAHEIIVVSDSSISLAEYSSALSAIILPYSNVMQNGGGAQILQQALAENDPSLLTKLTPIEDAYATIIARLLSIPTPASFATDHVDLLNSYETLRTDVRAMQLAFLDPLFALARVRTYGEDVIVLSETLMRIGNKLQAQGTEYMREEASTR